MSNLSNFELQIISKYLDYENTKELLKLNTSLRYSFDSTLNYISLKFEENINSNEQIIEKLLNIFPNLREIILNFKLEKYINDEYSNKILINYQNFLNVIENINKNKNKNINIKINFNYPLHVFINHKYTIDKFNEWLDKIVGILKNSIFICFSSIYDNDDDLYKLCKKYKTINFVKEIHYLSDEKYKDIINNTLFKPEIENLYYSYFGYQPFFKTIDEYYKNLYLYKFKNIIYDVKHFSEFYSSIKIRNLLKTELLKYNSIDLNLLNSKKYITSNYKLMNENMRSKSQVLDKQLLEFLNKGDIKIYEQGCSKLLIFKNILSKKYCDYINSNLFIHIKKILINNEIIFLNDE